MRDDVSSHVIHFVGSGIKGEQKDEQAFAMLNAVLADRSLHASDGRGLVAGQYEVVCFTEAPVGKLPYVLAGYRSGNHRYAPYGVMIPKVELFEAGGRPVLYQSREEFDLLPERLRWRHVTYKPTNGDPIGLTAEREWRICADYPLNSETATIVVPTRHRYRELVEEHAGDIEFAVAGLGEDARGYIEAFPWQIIVLSDLGLTFDF